MDEIQGREIWEFIPKFSDFFNVDEIYDHEENEALLIEAANKLGW